MRFPLHVCRFIVSNLPITILNYVSLLLHVNTKESTTSTRVIEELSNDDPRDSKLDETFTFLRSVFSLLVYLNISCHFGMFIFSGKLFRREFMQLLESCACVRNCCHLPLAWFSRHSSFSRKTSCESFAVAANGGDRSVALAPSHSQASNGLRRGHSSTTLCISISNSNNNNNAKNNFNGSNGYVESSSRTPSPSPLPSRTSSANAQTLRPAAPSLLVYMPANGPRGARFASNSLSLNLNCSDCAAAAARFDAHNPHSLLAPTASASSCSPGVEQEASSSGLLETDL